MPSYDQHMDRLTLTLRPDDDGTVELRGSVQGGEFAGSGSAWFDVEALKAFCSSLAAYPIDPRSPPSIAGGYWDKSGGKLRETHLAVRITPFDSRGAIQVSVQMAEPAAMNESADRGRNVSTWFVVGYNDLQLFQSALTKVLAGTSDEAVLTTTLS
jgi:hypothetical protein